MAALIALVTLVVVNALYVWNDLLIAIIFMQDDAKRTLMAGISVFQGRYNNQVPLTMAGMVIASAPMFILYVLFQKQFIRGLPDGPVPFHVAAPPLAEQLAADALESGV